MTGVRRCVSCAATLQTSGWSCTSCGHAPASVDGLPVLAPELAHGNASDAEYEYHELHAAERGHFWFTSRARLIAWAVRRYFPEATSVFDVGCGTGGVLMALRSTLPGLRLAGADALLAGLAFARRGLPDVAFAQMDIHQLPYDREFDVVGVFDVLEHLDDDEHALREIHRSLTPGEG
jgi:SAM-dependent methyltransferase